MCNNLVLNSAFAVSIDSFLQKLIKDSNFCHKNEKKVVLSSYLYVYILTRNLGYNARKSFDFLEDNVIMV